MKLFLDTSVLLAACNSTGGASREIFRRASVNQWVLITTPYGVTEVQANLHRLSFGAATEWSYIRSALQIMKDVMTLDRPVIFEAKKDHPILFGAIAWADLLPTLDKTGFGELMDKPFYGLRVMKPGTFLERERVNLRLR